RSWSAARLHPPEVVDGKAITAMDRDSENLIANYFAGELTTAERAELEATLAGDPQRMADFAEKLLLHKDLGTDAVQDVLSAAALPPAAAGANVVFPANTRSRLSRIPHSVWAIAASVAVVAAWLFFGGDRPGDPPQATQVEVRHDPEKRVVAFLGRTADCVWEGAPLGEGTQLTVGSRLQLASGVAEVIFNNGARLKALGPCDVYMDDAQACSVRLGSASVYVPQSAFGFKVVMPSGIVVDLGTEFGVTVDDAGSSEVHVFKGEVAFQPITERGDHFEKAIRLTADQAAQYSIGGTTLQEFEANEARFSWRNREPLADDEVPGLPVRKDVVLWLAADRFVDVDERGRVARWSDLQISDNPSAEDALQLNPDDRPLLVDKAINGRPAVRFGNGSFLLTPPLATTNEQTAVVMLALRQTAPDFQTVLNYNGPPKRVVGPLGGMVSPSVFEICLRDRNHDQRFAVCGELFTGYQEGGKTEVIKSMVEDFDRLQKNKALAVAVRYSLQDQRMSLFINGEERQSKHASRRIAITSRKLLGRHPIFETENGIFYGDLGEVLIYNRALSDDEVIKTSKYLTNRFGLTGP
ncbi:MAG TPA: LamG-like jellyroll fold domain-containing protein, partial [Lacipirellula sp.]